LRARCEDGNDFLWSSNAGERDAAAEFETRAADLFIVAGSSLVVYPAAASPELAKDSGATTLVIINREPTGLETFADFVLNRPIGETLGRRLDRPHRS